MICSHPSLALVSKSLSFDRCLVVVVFDVVIKIISPSFDGHSPNGSRQTSNAEQSNNDFSIYDHGEQLILSSLSDSVPCDE